MFFFPCLEAPMLNQLVRRRRARALAAGATAVAAVLLTPAVSSAVPTAEFTIGTAAPATGEPVRFTFTGTCDVPPCRVVWTWFQDGGSRLGTKMGEGEQIDYAFPRAGLYSVVAKVTNSTFTHGSASVTHALDVGTKVQENDPVVRLGGWNGVPAAEAVQGAEHVGLGTARLSFRGGRLDYVARTGPDRGIARVSVDGRVLGSVDLYSATPGSRTRSFTGLGTGPHLARIWSTGTRNAASTDTPVSIDELVVGGGTVHVDDSSLRVVYAGWSGMPMATADGGTERVSDMTGAKVTLPFTGTSVTWETATGPDQGVARILVDGVPLTTVDNYSAAPVAKVRRTFTVLTSGDHVLQVVVAGQHRAESTSSQVSVDAFVF
jgi:hypothetical protein